MARASTASGSASRSGRNPVLDVAGSSTGSAPASHRTALVGGVERIGHQDRRRRPGEGVRVGGGDTDQEERLLGAGDRQNMAIRLEPAFGQLEASGQPGSGSAAKGRRAGRRRVLVPETGLSLRASRQGAAAARAAARRSRDRSAADRPAIRHRPAAPPGGEKETRRGRRSACSTWSRVWSARVSGPPASGAGMTARRTHASQSRRRSRPSRACSACQPANSFHQHLNTGRQALQLALESLNQCVFSAAWMTRRAKSASFGATSTTNRRSQDRETRCAAPQLLPPSFGSPRPRSCSRRCPLGSKADGESDAAGVDGAYFASAKLVERGSGLEIDIDGARCAAYRGTHDADRAPGGLPGRSGTQPVRPLRERAEHRSVRRPTACSGHAPQPVAP